jgi:hypothetical protein
MAYGDNRRTPKMTRKRNQAKRDARLKRRAAEVKASRQANKQVAAPPAESGKKSKAKKPPKGDKS